ncbi:hypothetical protein CBS101457_004709 [Exobasidium rhododendri]|nr:hypothetical protein CBS101457_004709 [Exobasidium rhododendri]
MPPNPKMSRGGPSKPFRKQDKDYNAQQAQARKDRKAKSDGPSDIQDVFEYVTNQEDAKREGGSKLGKRDSRMTKRAQRNDAGDEDAREGKREIDSDEESGGEKGDEEVIRFKQTRPNWDNEDEGVRSEDDEEIDSDEAFGESDEERFEGWKFGQGKKMAGSAGQGSKGEESEDEEEDDDDEDDDDMMDLSKLLDAGDSEEDSQSDLDEEEEEGDSDLDDERLQRRMESLASTSGKKRAAADDEEGDAHKGPKRRVLRERTEAVPEGEWSAPSRTAGSSMLTIDDLMDPLREQGGTTFTALRDTAKTLKQKRGSERQGLASKKGGSALQAPLPSIIQDRLDRSAAYDETKAEVQGWQSTIKRIREAEHLSFPLQPDPVVKPSTSLMTSQFKPSNTFERDVAAMLEKEGLSEKRITEIEELEMNERGMSAAEIKSRREELRKMRDLLFREEQKARRVSRIKSKTYRKIARKQRERELAKAKEAGLLLGDEDGEGEKDDREMQERLRAKERATLKHKNTGKWAKNTIGLQGDMPEARNAIEEQLRKGEQLRRRIQGRDSEEEEGGLSDSEEDEESRDGEDNAFDELRDLEKKTEAQRLVDEEDMEGKKGVWGMKFMKEARNRKAKDTQDDILNFQKEIRELNRGDDSDVDEEQEDEIRHRGTNPGRMAFLSSASASVPAPALPREEAGKETVAGFSSALSASTSPAKENIHVKDIRSPASLMNGAAEKDANPWLSGKGVTKLSKKKNESTVSKEGTAQSKAANKISKHIAKGDAERKEAFDDAQLDIDPEARLQLQHGTEAKNKQARKTARVSFANEDEGSSEDSLDDEPIAVRGKGPIAMRQRDLVAEAFAGDDVTAEFEAEKSAIMEADAPQVIDTTLPGWGAWTGKGVRTNKKRQEEQKRRFSKVLPGLDPSKRKDANMTNVIINHKKDKKVARYTPTDVPYPYTSRAQYEMAMRNPLGPEWNTRTQHQKMTLPKVLTKPGKAIKPIEKLF